MSRTAALTLAITVTLGAASAAAFQVGVRRGHGASPPAAPVAVTLDAAVAPSVVPYGGTVVVTGTLRDVAGRPLPGRVVEAVVTRVDAGVPPVVVGAPRTDALGQVSVSFRPAAGAEVRLRFAGQPARAAAADPGAVAAAAAGAGGAAAGGAAAGGAGGGGTAAGAGPWLAPAESAPAAVGVAPVVRIAGRSTPSAGGWTTTLTGSLHPGGEGWRVRLERQVSGAWRAVSTGRLSRTGTFSFTVRVARPGTYPYRVVRAGSGAWADASGRYDVRIAAPRAPALPGLPKGAGGPGQLLVSGDSLAYYLGQQLATARGKRPTAVDARPSTGLARPEYFDWTAYAKTQVAKTPPGAVVVFIGANDCQPLREGGTGAWATVGSTRWVAEYRRRSGALMRAYGGGGTRPVYWIGLPIAREADITACYRSLNAATAAAAKDVGGVSWIESWSVYAVNGAYNDYVQGVLARQEDGIHLTFAGTRFLTRKVYALLRP